jgi:hypothetical protein
MNASACGKIVIDSRQQAPDRRQESAGSRQQPAGRSQQTLGRRKQAADGKKRRREDLVDSDVVSGLGLGRTNFRRSTNRT